jgi:hypothetical protein
MEDKIKILDKKSHHVNSYITQINSKIEELSKFKKEYEARELHKE